MPRPVKITIIGAGSATFSAGIVVDLCLHKDLVGTHVCFMDVDESRLAMIGRLAQRLSDELGSGLRFSEETARTAALRGADFVINTAQVGGHDWTEAQRDLAEEHGYYRGIGLHNFGQAAFHLEVARDVAAICPEAWLIQSANPVFEACTLIHRQAGIKILGLCHGHYGYRRIARALGLEMGHVSAQTPGFNHWIWMTDFRYRGEDAYPLLDCWIEEEAETYWANDDRGFMENQMRPAAIHLYQLFGLMPIGDTPRMAGWWYHTDLATKQRWFGPTGGFDSEIGWGRYLRGIEARVAKIREAAQDDKRPITETFPARLSGEQIVPIIDSLVNDREAVYQVNIPNLGGIIRGFPEDLVVECQGVVSGAGIRGVVPRPFPAKLVAGAMIPRWHLAELMVNALRMGDPDLLLLYLLQDHRTKDLSQAEALLSAWLADPRNERVARLFGQS